MEPITRNPLVVAYGMGVDSTAMLVGLWQRGERPDLILFADTGDEKPETYAYLEVINGWLDRVGFPRVTVVKNPRPKSNDRSLSESCVRNRVLPALAYGQHQCSIVWKIDPQRKFVKNWQPARDAWAQGLTVTQCVGYDAGPRDSVRRFKAEGKAADGYANRFPLIEWGWDRDRCKLEIAAAGLPIPAKSSCFHCPASKREEIVELRERHPDLYARALDMERLAHERGLKTIKGLGRTFSWSNV